MKKLFLKITALIFAGTMLFGLGGCSLFSGGKDAYEIAVEEGFVGTRAEWLQSLRGADGDDGDDVNLRELYADEVAAGNFEGSYSEFLREYFSVSADLKEDNDTEQIAHNMMSVVRVRSGFDKGTSTSVSEGAGVIVDLDKANGNATIITNYHVVFNADASNSTGIADYLYVYLYGGVVEDETKNFGGDSIAARYVGGSIEYDIAVLKIEGKDELKESHAEAAIIGNSEEVKVGEKVFAIGNPAAEGFSVTGGIISKDSEKIDLSMEIRVNGTSQTTNKTYTYRVMRTDAPINKGNSGGGLFNANGELIGIVNAKTILTSYDDMGYAIPINNAYAFAQNILDNNGVLKRATLGAVFVVPTAEGYIENGVLKIKETVKVETVVLGGNCFGKLYAGDEILALTINGVKTQITRMHQIGDLLLTVRSGNVIVEYKRGNNVYSATINPSYAILN